jgi:cytoskeletal protein CcmA (bactofilin family)
MARKNNGKKRDAGGDAPVTSVLGADCSVCGEISCSGTIRIDGSVEGKVESEDTIIVGQNGKVNASLHANQIIIGGEVRGDVTADERVEIQPTGTLLGDVRAPKLAISEGVVFQGRCMMDAPEPDKLSGHVPGEVQILTDDLTAHPDLV